MMMMSMCSKIEIHKLLKDSLDYHMDDIGCDWPPPPKAAITPFFRTFLFRLKGTIDELQKAIDDENAWEDEQEALGKHAPYSQ